MSRQQFIGWAFGFSMNHQQNKMQVLLERNKPYTRTCINCQVKNGTCQKPAGLLQPIPAGELFDRMGIDLLGLLSKTTQGQKYVITYINYGMRWTETTAVRMGTASEVTQFLLENVTCRHLAHSKILTDMGKVFSSAVVQELLHLLDIQGTMASGYSPQCRDFMPP
ncbi:hypothetical protein PR048_013257 [Dryococelus australis]|uniref:Integrase catalytic domain-containing protein n=1 Tax=Dryococelus australis TaxID=614101 RepID=A0ABQ9HRM3_9NEOP|nr:hypothetical protein PR048_013257 [Dryococelus australis]